MQKKSDRNLGPRHQGLNGLQSRCKLMGLGERNQIWVRLHGRENQSLPGHCRFDGPIAQLAAARLSLV